jgi:phytoene dehydrogenase-like protein
MPWSAPLAAARTSSGRGSPRSGSGSPREVLGPPDIEARIGLTGGNIFQGEVTPDQMWEHRLAPHTPIDGF